MKKLQAAGVLLLLACAIFGVISVFIYIGEDHTPPEISIEDADITYTEGEAYTTLMEGVTARDNIDGDLTEKVFVDKVIPTGDDTAVVYYGVIDSSRNVGTKSRKISYISADASAEAGAGAAQEAPQEAPQEPAAQTEQTTPEEGAAGQTLEPAGERPVLALSASSASVAVGTGFDPMSVVQGMADDKDSVDILSQKVMLDGTYDTSVPGTYNLSFYVMDSDGNASDPVAFTLTVQ